MYPELTVFPWTTLPAVLTLLIFGLTTTRRIPAKLYIIVALLLTTFNIVCNGWKLGLLSFASALLIFVTLAGVRLLTRPTTFALTVTLSGLSILYWWLLLPGFVVAGTTATIQLRRTGGAGYLQMLTGETFAAVGMAGGLAKPDLSRLPLPNTDTTSTTSIGKAQTLRLPFLRFVSFGTAVTWLIVVLVLILAG